ncbi:transpeptidase [Microlunatus endophyticus]|uniref:Transpeptidase n=1 Tax=Microlunatus endophyticus TaxID=1716077 RepID=A0A917W0W7_9ACTN|nr:Ig-like domain-containing protein [Microlunatus endophyticus]GGL53797.1 transpeptidase [Microlunatus endophyticus]
MPVGGRTKALGVGAVATLLIAGVGLTGCTSSVVEGDHPSVSPAGSSSPSPSPTAGSSPASDPSTAAPATLRVNVSKGADGVKVDKMIQVTAVNGTLSKITVSGRYLDHGVRKKATISGSLNDAKTHWKASDLLEPGGSYTLKATAVGADGHTTTTSRKFTAEDLGLDQQIYPSFVSLGTKVGVGTPVVLTFDRPVTDKAEFEKHLHVTSTPSQPGSWHWYSDTEVHWRPKTYWKPGTKVTATADLNSVPAGNGEYGQQNASTSFTVGKSVITKVNLKTDVAKVYVDGKLARKILVSGGKPGDETSSGTTVITQKLTNYTMTSEMIGLPKTGPESYSLVAAYAMRITTSGQFLHSAPWNTGYFGNTNASHGCVGMSVADSGWLFDEALPGSPVTVTGTSRPLEGQNGLTDWNVSYQTYAAGSALR